MNLQNQDFQRKRTIFRNYCAANGLDRRLWLVELPQDRDELEESFAADFVPSFNALQTRLTAIADITSPEFTYRGPDDDDIERLDFLSDESPAHEILRIIHTAPGGFQGVQVIHSDHAAALGDPPGLYYGLKNPEDTRRRHRFVSQEQLDYAVWEYFRFFRPYPPPPPEGWIPSFTRVSVHERTERVQQPQTWLGYHRRRPDRVVLNTWSLFALEWLQDMHHRDPIRYPKGIAHDWYKIHRKYAALFPSLDRPEWRQPTHPLFQRP